MVAVQAPVMAAVQNFVGLLDTPTTLEASTYLKVNGDGDAVYQYIPHLLMVALEMSLVLESSNFRQQTA